MTTRVAIAEGRCLGSDGGRCGCTDAGGVPVGAGEGYGGDGMAVDPCRGIGTPVPGAAIRPPRNDNRGRRLRSAEVPPIGLPPVVLVDAEGRSRLCPWLLSVDDVADLFRLHDSGTRFPRATIARYRRMGLRSVRVGRRVWFMLPDVLRFLESSRSSSMDR